MSTKLSDTVQVVLYTVRASRMSVWKS